MLRRELHTFTEVRRSCRTRPDICELSDCRPTQLQRFDICVLRGCRPTQSQSLYNSEKKLGRIQIHKKKIQKKENENINEIRFGKLL